MENKEITKPYYVKNEESGKLNIFLGKDFYQNLPDTGKAVFRSHCLWSRTMDCWISKAKEGNCWYLKSKLVEMGIENRGSTGERLPFEQQISRQQEKAAGKVERSEKRAENAEKRSDELFRQAKDMASIIPFGQPILVGHHSEKRDRNYRESIHNKFGKSFKEQEKAEYYKGKAETAKETAEGKKFSNPSYLTNRIKDAQKHLRILERRLQGKLYPGSPVKEISEQERSFYNKRIGDEQEKLDYYIKCMKVINPDYQEMVPAKSVPQKKGKGKSQ